MPPRRPTSGLENHLNELRRLAETISGEIKDVEAGAKKRNRHAIESVVEQLLQASSKLDSVRRPKKIFDPTHPDTAGRIVALTLVAQEKHPLARVPEFYGSGVYAIYYRGNFAPYAQLAASDHPIYVGKADPAIATAKDAVTQGSKLSSRLKEHAKSIAKATSTLRIEDFECRFLFVQSGFQESAERFLIDFFKPIWNKETKVCFGIGKHGDSPETRKNKRSPWDTMHSGRSWSDGTSEDQKSRAAIVSKIDQHLALYPPYKDIHKIFDHFIGDMKQLDAFAE